MEEEEPRLKRNSLNSISDYKEKINKIPLIDYDKYRKKVEKYLKEIKDNPLKTKGNIGSIEHLIKKRLNLPGNSIQVGFDSTLRNFKHFETISGHS